jgi:hypothetical protein
VHRQVKFSTPAAGADTGRPHLEDAGGPSRETPGAITKIDECPSTTGVSHDLH